MPESPNNFVPLNFFRGLESFNARLARERAFRVENGKHALSFGVSFLDEALGGIYRNDFIILGAKTGFGKSQLATLIALSNVKAGKRVHFIALEAEEYEIERRIKYQLISDIFYSMQSRPRIHLNYLDWYHAKFDEQLFEIEKEVESAADLSGLNVYYRQNQFHIEEFERLIFGIKDLTDLIIIDHLHYFDHEDENENRAIKNIMKKIRDCAQISGKPVILVSHVRKPDKRLKQLIPDIDDFHGSSDIGKIGTQVITIAPWYEKEARPPHRKTLCQVLKCRPDGARTQMTALMAFNINNHRYERQYQLGQLSFDSTEFNPFDFSGIPFWATNAIAAGGKD